MKPISFTLSGYAVMKRGGGQDQPYLADSLKLYQEHFGRAPNLLTGDRGTTPAGSI